MSAPVARSACRDTIRNVRLVRLARAGSRLVGFALLLAPLATGALAWPDVQARYSATTDAGSSKWQARNCYVSQLLGNPGFETGTASPWTVTLPSEINSSSLEPPHTGLWDAWLAPTAATPLNLSQTVTVRSGCSSATLSFWLHIDTSGVQGVGKLMVQILNSGGTVLATLATFNHASLPYTQYSYNVLPYAGQTITVRFASTETLTRVTNFVIDDVALTIG